MKLIYVDIDETICNREASSDFGVVHDYTKAKPIKENIAKINKLYDEGNTLCIGLQEEVVSRLIGKLTEQPT